MLTDELLSLQSTARRFLGGRTARNAADGTGPVNSGWQDFADLGWLGVAIDEAHGGFGGAQHLTVLAQELAAAIAPEPFLQAAVVPAVFLAHAPPSPQREPLLESLISGGTRIVAAFEQPGMTANPLRFARQEAGITLFGRLTHMLGGADAQRVLLCARQVDQPEIESVFLADVESSGIRRAVVPTIDGQRAALFELDGLQLPADCEWPQRESALATFWLSQDAGVIGQCAELVGLMRQMFELTRGYLSERRQFGQLLSQFQALRHRLADMFAELEQARAMLTVGADALNLPSARSRARLVSACKLRVARAARFVGAQAIQLHGAIALTQEYAVGRAYQRMLVLEKTWGDPEFHTRRFLAAAGDNDE